MKKKVVVYNLHHNYFFDLFKDIYLGLIKNSIDTYFAYNSGNKELLQYLKDSGVPAEKIISNKISPFLPFDMFITAEVTGPDFPFKLLKTKKVQMYHGIGVHNLYEKKYILCRFDIHFAVGPQFRRFIEDSCSTKGKKPIIYNIGYPKTDRILEEPQSDLIAKYNPENKKVILYAPHWNEFGSLHELEEKIIECLVDFDAIILIKAHNYLYEKYNDMKWYERFKVLEGKYSNVKFVTEADTQILYPLSNVIITDTGTTAAFEFSLLEKPVIVYKNDRWFEGKNHTEVEKEIINTAETFTETGVLQDFVEKALWNNNDLTVFQGQRKLQNKMVRDYLYNPGRATKPALDALLEEL